jgi:hypothetical protein
MASFSSVTYTEGNYLEVHFTGLDLDKMTETIAWVDERRALYKQKTQQERSALNRDLTKKSKE